MAENVGGKIRSDIESGNPWHEPGSGKFADAPPGVNLVGESLSLLKVMEPQDKRAIDERLQKVSGDTLEVRQAGPNQVDVGVAGDGGAIGFRMELGKGEEGVSMEQTAGDEPDVTLPETVDDTSSDVTTVDDMDVPAVEETESDDVEDEVATPDINDETVDDEIELPETSNTSWADEPVDPDSVDKLDEVDIKDYAAENGVELDDEQVQQVAEGLTEEVPDGVDTFGDWLDAVIKRVVT